MSEEYTLENVYFECGECLRYEEGVKNMINHILEEHPTYTPIEAEKHATVWAEARLDEIDAENVWRGEEFRRTGHDPLKDVDEDPL